MMVTGMEVSDHVYVFPMETEYFGDERTWHPTGVETRQGLYLFDVGGPGDADVLEEALAADGFELEDVDKIIMTHQDWDHLGCLAPVYDRADVEVVCHRRAAPYVSGEVRMIKRPEEEYPGVPVDLELTDGARIPTLAGPVEAIFTPGHAPGHLVFYFEDARLLVAGDLLRSEDEFSGPKRSVTPDLAEARRSIGKLCDRRIDRVLCFHGGPTDAGTGDIQRVYDTLVGEV